MQRSSSEGNLEKKYDTSNIIAMIKAKIPATNTPNGSSRFLTIKHHIATTFIPRNLVINVGQNLIKIVDKMYIN
jgi:hypothetical protein